MIKIPYSPNLMKNLEKYPAKRGSHCCCICGKPVPEPFKYSVWEHNGGGYLVTRAEAQKLSPGADLGEQPVGADCWRKNPSIHPYKYPKD